MTTCSRRWSGTYLSQVIFSLALLGLMPFASAQTASSPPASTGSDSAKGTASSSATPNGSGATSSVSSNGSASSATQVQAFAAQQQALELQLGALIAAGATPGQIQAWQQQNASVIASQQQLGQTIAANTPLQSLPYITEVALPADASQDTSNFLSTWANLYNKYVQLHNQQAAAGAFAPADVTVIANGNQQNATEIGTQAQQGQVVAGQLLSQPWPVPPALSLPPGISPRLAAFLTLRDQIMRAHITLWNQLLNDTPAQRQAALQAWQQQNAGRIQQMQSMALAASPSTTN